MEGRKMTDHGIDKMNKTHRLFSMYSLYVQRDLIVETEKLLVD